MITKEEYERTYVRMMDSARTTSKGQSSCDGVVCSDCPIKYICETALSNTFKAYRIVEAVEQWGKAHPVITNYDKFKEVFHNMNIETLTSGCGGFKCPQGSICNDCEYKDFWSKEYEGGK